jgi:hypothetical protein
MQSVPYFPRNDVTTLERSQACYIFIYIDRYIDCVRIGCVSLDRIMIHRRVFWIWKWPLRFHMGWGEGQPWLRRLLGPEGLCPLDILTGKTRMYEGKQIRTQKCLTCPQKENWQTRLCPSTRKVCQILRVFAKHYIYMNAGHVPILTRLRVPRPLTTSSFVNDSAGWRLKQTEILWP